VVARANVEEAQQVVLQGTEILFLDGYVGHSPEPGVHPVDGLTGTNGPLDECGRGVDAGEHALVPGQPGRRPVAGHGDHFLNGEPFARDVHLGDLGSAEPGGFRQG